MTKYRNEWKYEISDNQIQTIKYNLERVADIDKHAIGGRSVVRSLYFDGFSDSSMFDNDAGVNYRYKWRIKYYNNDLNYIVLEKKKSVTTSVEKSNVN